MLICHHRVNTSSELLRVPLNQGVEIDLRSNLNGEVFLAHDPFENGELLDTWLESYRHSFIVANLKEEGLEDVIIRQFASRKIQDWAFLDQSFPFLVKQLASGNTKTMIRVSDLESAKTALALGIRPDWAWIDSFSGHYPSENDLIELVAAGFKLMMVSPELHGRDPNEGISTIKSMLGSAGIRPDAVCTKIEKLWAES